MAKVPVINVHNMKNKSILHPIYKAVETVDNVDMTVTLLLCGAICV